MRGSVIKPEHEVLHIGPTDNVWAELLDRPPGGHLIIGAIVLDEELSPDPFLESISRGVGSNPVLDLLELISPAFLRIWYM